MFKKICSLAIVLVMMLSLASSAFAEFVYIEGFEENNKSAKQIELWGNYAIVVCGDGEAIDTLNVYDVTSKELVTTLGLPVYKTGKDYFAENIGVSGDWLFVSWNRHIGSGDPSVRRYNLNDIVAGKLEHVEGKGIRDDKVSYVYKNKLYFTDPKTINISSISTDSSARDGFMVLPSAEDTKNIKGLLIDDNYFYIYRQKEIRVYSAENIHAGINQTYSDTKVIYNSEKTIEDITLYDGKLYVSYEEGLEIFAVDGETLKSVGTYTKGGKIMAVEGKGSTLYVYADANKAIQILDISDLNNITVKEEIVVSNTQTEGIVDIAVSGQRIYAADLTEGFSMYSANEIDNLEKVEEVVAESYSEELELSRKAKAIELVVGLKIMNLRSNGLFGSNLYITRGEFAESSAKLLGNIVNGDFATKEFTDVPKDHDYAKSIYGLANIGILNGFGDGTFRPDDPVLYEHAVKILVRVLGYYPLVESGQRTTMELAAELGILKNVSAMNNGYISRENTAQLIYNSLETETLKFVGGVDPNAYEESKEETLLYKMGIKKVKGQVTATEFTSLTGTYTAQKGKVEINLTQYPEGTSSAGAYLGRFVTAYHKFDETDEKGEIIYVVKDNNESLVTVDAKDVLKETTKTVFAYFDEDEKVQRENIKNSSIIINGKFYADYKAEDLIPDDGQVVLIDAEGDGEYETVLVESFKTYVVEAYGRGVFKLKYGYSDINLNALPNDAKVYVTVDGLVCDSIEKIANVAEWSILSVKKSFDGKIYDIYATNNKITGIITETNGDKSVKLDNTEYKISRAYITNTANPVNNIKRVEAGDEVHAYFDLFGKLAATKEVVSSAVYGYMVGCTRGEGLDTDKASFKIFARDNNNLFGSMQYFEAAENFKVNGKKVEDIHTITELFDPQTGLKRQLVKFILNSEGKIRSLETALNRAQATLPNGDQNPNYDAYYAGYDENSFSFDAVIGKSQAYRVGSMGTFEGEPFLPDSMTQIFVIPTIEDDAKDDDYKIYGYTTIFKSGGTHQAPLHLYDVTENYKINAIVIKATAADIDAVTSSGSYALVDSFVQGLTEDGERKWMLRSAKDANGEYTDIPIADEEIADTLGAYNASYKDKKLLELPKGSIVQYIKDGYGEIANIAIMFIPDSDNKVYFEYGNTKPSATSMPVKFYSAFGKIFKVTDGRIIFNAHGEIDDNADKVVDRIWDGDINTAQRNWDRNLKIAGTKYLYDSNTGKISTITTEDILPGDDMYIIKSSVYVKFIVIYR